MLGEVVSVVFCTEFPVDVKFSLEDATTNPVVYHVKYFASFFVLQNHSKCQRYICYLFGKVSVAEGGQGCRGCPVLLRFSLHCERGHRGRLRWRKRERSS